MTKEVKTEKRSAAKAASAPSEDVIVNLQQISKHYGKIVALSDINLTIERGEFVSLVGPSGAGKSTLIRLLIAEERPSTGRIFIAGRDITQLRANELPFYRRKIGVVFQDFKLLPQMTVAENVAFALEVADVPQEEIERRVPKMLELVGMTSRSENFPTELSGGERQRVAIARAMVHSPKILIADEPTGNLDPDNTKDIIELLQRINTAGTLVILATHNKEVVNGLKRRVILIKGGKVMSDQKVGQYVQ
jgi:cell division transport system ATP-binding protein